MELAERIKGCIYAGAIGDCIGGYFENTKRQPGNLLDFEWRISDDTQLTMATCEAIIESKGVSAERIANRMLHWFNNNMLTGLGSSTLGAIKALQVGGHWALAGRTGEFAAGNGAAMRIAPLAFTSANRQVISDVCRITHRNEAYVGALAVVESIRIVINGGCNDINDLMQMLSELLPDTAVRDRLILLSKETLPINTVAQKYGNSGYVVDTVPLAIYAAANSKGQLLTEIFEEIVLGGGDTDTICSIAGNIAGTFYGHAALPKEYITKFEQSKDALLVSRIVESFADYSSYLAG